MTEQTTTKRKLQGKVMSTKMQKTVVVAVVTEKRHPIYSKLVESTKRYKARDEIGVAEGDIITIEETRPYSKEVTWKVVEVIEPAH